LFGDFCPTPQLSFAVPFLRANAGLMITASHNSWKDNGCKIYDEYGCQITPQQAHRLYLAMTSGSDRLIDLPEKKSAPAKESLRPIDKKVTTAYYLSALDGLLNMPLTQAKGSSFSIVYTPFYGAGRKAVSEVLTKAGFNSLFVVPEQEYADGCFATLPRPNPEYHETFKLALKYARQSNADLVLATDPDADRLGLCCKDGDTYNILSGNQVGLLLAYYLFSQKAAQKMLPADGILIRSMVSTPLADKLAAHFGVSTSVTAVGSCHIGAGIMRIKQSGQGSFLFGFEESLGYIMPGHCLEKDAVAAAALAAEAALYYRETKDHTLVQVLANIYRQFGYFLHYQETIALPGYRARERAADFMESLSSLACRECTVEMLADPPFPLILRFIFGEGNYVIVRPSGTEPKIKLYYGAQASTKARASSNLAYLRRSFKRLLEENK
jgi:phosphoglucomutase